VVVVKALLEVAKPPLLAEQEMELIVETCSGRETELVSETLLVRGMELI